VRSKSQQKRHNRYVIAPLILIGVNVVLFLVFFVWPGALGLIYSFTDYRGLGRLNFIGLRNFETLFADRTFYAALSRTFLYTVLSVPLIYVSSLGVAALLVSRAVRGRTAAKIIIFLPWLISPIVVGVIWKWMFGQDFGFVNFIISTLGGNPLPWSSNGNLALTVVIFAAAWGGTAFNMLIFIAALKNVPRAYYEAAQIDGANAWQRFLHLTLPMLVPALMVVLIFRTISAFLIFDVVFIMTGGGPGETTETITYLNWKAFLVDLDFGAGAAISIVLVVLALLISAVYVKTLRPRV
jgi:alpha-1,4-digalacturonate transport system permease protein